MLIVALTINNLTGIHVDIERRVVLTITASLFGTRFTPVRNGQINLATVLILYGWYWLRGSIKRD